jgi:hypothetical protein
LKPENRRFAWISGPDNGGPTDYLGIVSERFKTGAAWKMNAT